MYMYTLVISQSVVQREGKLVGFSYCKRTWCASAHQPIHLSVLRHFPSLVGTSSITSGTMETHRFSTAEIRALWRTVVVWCFSNSRASLQRSQQVPPVDCELWHIYCYINKRPQLTRAAHRRAVLEADHWHTGCLDCCVYSWKFWKKRLFGIPHMGYPET